MRHLNTSMGPGPNRVARPIFRSTARYAANQKTLTDSEAANMIKRWADIQVVLSQTRQKYIPLVDKVISPRKAALFFRIDRWLYALMDLQTSSKLPLFLQ